MSIKNSVSFTVIIFIELGKKVLNILQKITDKKYVDPTVSVENIGKFYWCLVNSQFIKGDDLNEMLV